MEELRFDHVPSVHVTGEENSRNNNTLDKFLYSNMSTDGSNDNELVYLSSLRHVLDKGVSKADRTGTGTLSVFGPQCVYDLRKGFPLLTTKKMAWNGIIQELWWFLRGETNNNILNEAGVHIWDQWANAEGELGPVYGEMWRAYPSAKAGGETTDQIENLIDDLIHDRFSRRMLVNAWHPALVPISGLSHRENIEAGFQVLPPCHLMWQVNVEEIPTPERIIIGGKDAIAGCADQSQVAQQLWLSNHNIPRFYIDLKLYQRSGDIFLGVPFNVASYSALLVLLSYLTGYIPRYFIHSFGDLHLYRNHLSQAQEQLRRVPKASPSLFSGLSVTAASGDSQFAKDTFNHILNNSNVALLLNSYDSHGPISAPVSV